MRAIVHPMNVGLWPSVLFLIVKSCCHYHLHSVHNLKDLLDMLYNKYCLQMHHVPVALRKHGGKMEYLQGKWRKNGIPAQKKVPLWPMKHS